MPTAFDEFLRSLTTREYQERHRARLWAEALAARTSLTYLAADGRYIQEWPATGERREIELPVSGV